MHYLAIDLPPDPAARAARITFERAQGGTIYLRPDATHVLARETWPPMARGLTPLPDDRTGWIEIAA